MPTPTARARRALVEGGQGPSTPALRVLTVVVCVVAGFMMATAAVNARGSDLRPNRNTDLVSLVRSEAQRNQALAARLAELRAEIDRLAALEGTPPPGAPSASGLAAAALDAAVTPVVGPAVRVTLTDAPLSVNPAGVDEDLLVVHQQDIQAVLNALWAGGAEAVSVQGQRISATTGLKCVGNTVVVDGVPYAPPYVIVGIGDVARLEESLTESAPLRIYRDYVDAYGLGWRVERVRAHEMAGYQRSVEFQWAKPAR